MIALKKPIILIGMMGSGKSTLGRSLAQALSCPFIDADTEIERIAGCSIGEIFSQKGEAAFRALEKSVLADLVDHFKGVIATGGGAIMDEDTRKNILQKGLVIWLQASLDTLFERAGHDKTRPLLKSSNPKEILADLLEIRQAYYALAPIHILNDQEDLLLTLEKLTKIINRFT
jgi:shikimate kinase